jgi:hypothetical protein
MFNNILYGGGGGGGSGDTVSIECTQAYYDALPEADKLDPSKVYYIKDAASVENMIVLESPIVEAQANDIFSYEFNNSETLTDLRQWVVMSVMCYPTDGLGTDSWQDGFTTAYGFVSPVTNVVHVYPVATIISDGSGRGFIQVVGYNIEDSVAHYQFRVVMLKVA